MAPPPSQAGRFKPRKPAKKISVGGEATGAPAPDAAPSSVIGSSQSGAGRGYRGSGGAGRDGRGRRGGGRDGAGRGRGVRAPIPQGQAFFTAQPAVVSSSGVRQRRLPGTNEATSQLHNHQQLQQQSIGAGTHSNPGGGSLFPRTVGAVGGPEEEIVGTLDSAIGSMIPASVKSAADANKSFRDPAQAALERILFGNGEDGGLTGATHGPDGYLYDSDSSCEEQVQQRTRHSSRDGQRAIQMPLSLPFPPVERVADGAPANQDTTDTKAPSPFVSSGNQRELQRETDSWFLVQLPTRLPPVQQQAELKNEDDMMVDGVPSMHDDIAPVATAPMQVNTFDNVLTNAVAGRIGTIKIYKSGKTVLILEGQDGVPTMTMNVSEGLSCGFQQQAVVIDAKDGRDYIPLGPVRKTVVVTPDLKGTV